MSTYDGLFQPRKNGGRWIVTFLIVAIVLLYITSCSTVALKCWHRGGTVIKNAFDWPVCAEIKRR